MKKIDTSKTPQEKALLHSAKLSWRNLMRKTYPGWIKRTACRLRKDGRRRMNIYEPKAVPAG